MRGAIENTKKILKQRNGLRAMTRSLMRQQMSSEGQTWKNFDFSLFKRNNKQLYSQLLDNDINIH